MQNRWFHRPELHVPRHGVERKVGWLELFYDLIYVAAIIQLGTALSDNVGPIGFLVFAALMAPVWATWTAFTFYSNRFVVDDLLHRALVFGQMFFVGAVAVSVTAVFDGGTTEFSLAYAGCRALLAALHLRTLRQNKEAKEVSALFGFGFGFGALVWFSAAFVPAPWAYVVWAIAYAIDLSIPWSKRARELTGRFPPDVLHMSERYGLLTIIVLGESFVKVLTAVSEHGLTPAVLGMGSLALVVTCSLWWIYFDDVAGSRIKGGRLNALTWVYAHLPMTIAVVGVGVAIKKAVFFAPSEVAPTGYRWLLCGTLALALACVALIDMVTERRQAEVSDQLRTNVRLGSALLVLLLVPIGGGVPAWVFVTLVSSLCVAQVLFDLSMAPVAVDPEFVHEGAHQVFRPVQAERAVAPTRVRRDATEAVRRGTPSELRRDLYFHFMEGSWGELLGFLGVVFVVSNTAFAGLYLLVDESVTGVAANDFVSAFAFSVQTMSTIGYGAMAPQTGWAHLIVTVEAAFGLLGVALATGIFFAKMARPRSAFLFSQPVVVTTIEGKPTLMFRVGNARGNEVVEAHMSLTVLRDVVTPEGQRFRRLHDLELVRSNSPVFSLSWTAMHVLDESSPLHGLTRTSCDATVVSLIVTMTGWDATYASTTHARHSYYPDDILFGRRFVDVISELDDGRLMVDYDKFHDTFPVAGEGAMEEE